MKHLLYLFLLLCLLEFVYTQPTPIVLWHGMGDSCCSKGMQSLTSYLQLKIPNVYVHSIQIGKDEEQDKERGFFDQLNRQVAQACATLKSIQELSRGFNAIGISQGGLFLRAYVQRCNDPPVHHLITFGSPHGGVSEFPGCLDKSDTRCILAKALIDKGVYWSWIQEKVVQAQYFRDYKKLNDYMQYNQFLTDLNQEIHPNQSYVDHIKSLKAFVMIQFANDTMIIPKQTASFGVWNESGELIPLEQQPVYQRLGLDELARSHRLFSIIRSGNHVNFEFFPPFCPFNALARKFDGYLGQGHCLAIFIKASRVSCSNVKNKRLGLISMSFLLKRSCKCYRPQFNRNFYQVNCILKDKNPPDTFVLSSHHHHQVNGQDDTKNSNEQHQKHQKSASNSLVYSAIDRRKDSILPFHFESTIDRIKFSEMLKSEGFNESQADALLTLVSEAIAESMRHVTDSVASKQERDINQKHNEFLFEQLKADIDTLNKGDFVLFKQDLEKVLKDIGGIKIAIAEEVNRAHGGVRLDINLEKSRIKDESSALTQLLTECENRVDREIQLVQDKMDSIKQSTRSSMIKFFIGCFALFSVFKIGACIHYFWKTN